MTHTLDTAYGKLEGITSTLTYKDGSLKSCMLNAENRVQTPVGEVIPQYKMAEYGERQKKQRGSLAFYPGGQLKSVSLDSSSVVQTPIGPLEAEYITFYEDGSLNRLFPLNGQVDGFWTEQMEAEMAEVQDFDLPVGKFSAKVISVGFYPGGSLRSLTLWPGQRILLETPVGAMRVRTGFSLYEDGQVRSVEPASPVELATPIGLVKAFDPEMVGMNADQNSVQFSPDGLLSSVKTIHTGIRVVKPGEPELRIEPLEAASLIEMTAMRTVPMQIDFGTDTVHIVAAQEYDFDLKSVKVETFEREHVIRESCGSCNGCEGDAADKGDAEGCCGGGGCGGGGCGGSLDRCPDCKDDETCCKNQ
ncbi:hypothetical protein [Ruficoccus sp. ZRK36]|uniref:hypothetical protein n=1 Tax=Ruficoccus sp. ZRK36 TaxID=2866311 RepID=UPI001C72B1AD|nr:hypothetical protein [Ruficoccus sp. ZRK36]QYY37062.1 hypothetical protein K0V07_06170 [Ruficoccus sp. ZRK36]